jgi:predicted MarR family transcription regulator
MKAKNITAETILGLNVTELRKVATELGVKNVSKFQKIDLQQEAIKKLPKQEIVKKEKVAKAKKVEVVETGVSKSDQLRAEIKASVKAGLSIDSGSLMKRMKEKYGIEMHRSFIITVKNNWLSLTSPATK